jgi:hypothetical protein
MAKAPRRSTALRAEPVPDFPLLLHFANSDATTTWRSDAFQTRL